MEQHPSDLSLKQIQAVQLCKLIRLVLERSRFAMTDVTSISRAEFTERYRNAFDKLFAFDEEGNCRIRVPANWELLEFEEMNLPGWSADEEIFQRFVNFISVVARPAQLVLAEVESIERFTEVRIVAAEREKIENLWNRSRLPHFKTACSDESARWCALFDNFTDKVSVCRAPVAYE